jgi:glyoxylase-like metal-dependent hydrolase (beta-lactamase superfamily II)
MAAGDIPFRKEMTFEYGVPLQVSPLVRRVVARNPSHFTFHGTNTYIVGHGRVAVIDPGPLLDEHLSALVAALDGETVEHILVTHTHHDHSPGAAPLRQLVDGGEIAGALARPISEGVQTAESIDREFAPDRELADGDVTAGDGWTLEAVFTPGHMSNHMCFALAQENILFSGDHIMGWNTTVVSPPDGNMGEYMASLETCLARDEATYWPAHGPSIPEPVPFVEAYRDHRHQRENQILDCLESGIGTIAAMVERIYRHIPTEMHPAAARSVLAHLEHMAETGRVATEDGAAAAADSHYRVA